MTNLTTSNHPALDPAWKQRQVGPLTLSEWSTRCQNWMREQDKRYDPGHRFDHLQRVFTNCLAIAAHETVELAIVIPAAWLHDCVPIAKDSPERAHASQLAAEQASHILTQWGYPSCYLDAISHAVAAHSYSANIKPKTIEAAVLQDADRLDALGAVGLARTLMIGGKLGSALYSVDDPFAANRPHDDRQFIIDHFHTKLFTLAGTMKTDTGRDIARQRQQILTAFLTELAAEINVPIPSPR